tara:strand:- start:60 stop:1703 length:1644 start_codon:yes stop_codon:yes gene_type:complete
MYTVEDLRGVDLDWLLELQVRGTFYRFATSSLDLVDDDGIPLHFVGTLEPVEYMDESGVFQDQVSDRHITLQLRFENGGPGGDALGITERAELDHDLGDAFAVVSLYRRGDSYNARQVMLRGQIDLETGAPGDPVKVTVRASPTLDRSLVPATQARVTRSTWPADGVQISDPAVLDQFYPLVFGEPGRDGTPGSPGLLVRINSSTGNNSTTDAWVLVCGQEVAAGSVTVENYTTPGTASASIVVEEDSLGRRVSVVKLAAAALPITTGDELWVSWDAGSGIPNHRKESTRGMGDLVRWLLGRSTLQIDTGRMRGLLQGLNAWYADFYVNGQRGAMQILVDDVLPMLPISPATGPDGLYYFRWHLDPLPSVAIDLNLDLIGGEVVGSIVWSLLDEIANSHTISFGWNPRSGDMEKRLTLAPFTGGDLDTETHLVAAASFTRYQGPDRTPLAAEPISSQAIKDPATALAILEERLIWAAGRRRVMQIQLPQQFQGILNPGSIVAVTEERHHLIDAVGLVTSVVRGPGSTMITIVRPNVWVRDALRATGT